MSNSTILKQAEPIFPTAEEEVKSLRAAYVLADNGWLEAAFNNDKALAKYGSAENLRQAIAKDPEKVELLYYPGLTAMAAHEKANELYKKAQAKGDSDDALADYAYARRLSEAAKTISGMDIHPGATIAKNFFVDHCTGVVIGETAVIGEDCFLLHGVTLGGGATKRDDGGRHPALGNGVIIGSNANVYGGCEIGNKVEISTGATIIDSNIGDGSKVSAGSRITKSKVGNNVKIYPEAQIFDCEIGEGAVIGAGVRLDKVTIPPYARICDVQQPKLVIYTDKAEHQGLVVTARNKTVMPKDANTDNDEKTITAPVFAEADDFQQVDNWQDKLAAYVSQKQKTSAVSLH